MINTLVKGLIAVGVVAVGVGAIVAVKHKKNYAEAAPEDFEEDEVPEDPTLKEKIAQAAIKMVNWITENKDRIEAASVVIGLMSACIDLSTKLGTKLNLPFKPKKALIVNNPETNDKYKYYEF